MTDASAPPWWKQLGLTVLSAMLAYNTGRLALLAPAWCGATRTRAGLSSAT